MTLLQDLNADALSLPKLLSSILAVVASLVACAVSNHSKDEPDNLAVASALLEICQKDLHDKCDELRKQHTPAMRQHIVLAEAMQNVLVLKQSLEATEHVVGGLADPQGASSQTSEQALPT